MNIKLIILLSAFFSSFVFSATIYDKFPQHISPQQKYVFYSHGFIVEGVDPTPKNKRWGVYDFPAIKQSLSDNTYNLIAYHRPKGTNPKTHAQALANDVRELIKHGVTAKNITIMGFSRGAFITSLASHYLAQTPVNTILLAGCGRIVSSKYADIELNGSLLSVYETTDGANSCEKLKHRSSNLVSFEEIAITTGQEHGAFYRPMPEWLIPVKRWIKQQGR